MFNDMKLPNDTKIRILGPDGTPILEEELIHVNALVHLATAGLDTKDSLTWPTYAERLAELLNEKYSTKFSPTQAWAIGERVVSALRELKEGFTKGQP